MKIFSVLTLILALTLSPLLNSAEPTPIPFSVSLEGLQVSSVLVRSPDGSSGSGSVFRSKAGEYLILTAAHVIFEAGGPVTVSQSILRDGKKIGEFTTLADVLVASHPWRSYDIAVLKPRDAIFTNAVAFYTGKTVPAIGTPIIHCGSLHGAWLERSITFGHIAALYRYRSDDQRYPLDFSTCAALPGSSGGGVFLASTGELIGFVDEWEGVDNVNFFVPIRSILQFFRESALDVAP